jgi:hypothetical protein
MPNEVPRAPRRVSSRPAWFPSVNTTPIPELARVIQSRSAGRARATPWAARVDRWLRAHHGFAILPELGRDELDEIREVFRLLDDDDSGALDARELIDGLSSTGANVDPEALRALVASVDFDGSGLIELDEFVVIMSSRRQLRAFRGALRDPNRPNDDSSSSSSDDERGTAAGGFDGTWARGLRRRRMIAAAREGGAARRRLLVAGARRADARRPSTLDPRALEAAHRAELAAFEARTPHPSSSTRRGNQSEGKAASTEVLAALSRAVASSAREEGFPAMSLAFLRERGSGDAAVEAAGRAVPVPGDGDGNKDGDGDEKRVPRDGKNPSPSSPSSPPSPSPRASETRRHLETVAAFAASPPPKPRRRRTKPPPETAEANPEKTDARRALIATLARSLARRGVHPDILEAATRASDADAARRMSDERRVYG